MGGQLNAIFSQVVQSGGGGVGSLVVVVEQQSAGAGVWAACVPSLEDLAQAAVDVPLGVESLPLLKRDTVSWLVCLGLCFFWGG